MLQTMRSRIKPNLVTKEEKAGTTIDETNQSVFVDLLKFLSTLRGDLANIAAPPFFLASFSVLETPRCWGQRPRVFAAPSFESDAGKRSLLVLQLFLIGLRPQLYIAGSPGVSIKKPLNAFLGELFFASWTENDATTKLISEQVSHHPPITAVHLADDDHGVRADGYARVEMTFNGSVNTRQIGHTMLHIDQYNEDYILPFPDVQVRGILAACFYPEITGSYHILSSSGYRSKIKFSGAGLMSGTRNQFEAYVYHESEPKTHLYEISGVWSESWIIKDGKTGEILETYHVEAKENEAAEMKLDRTEDQDPWESRRAWQDTIEKLERGDLRGAAVAKNNVEETQRRLRKQEKVTGERWTPLLFRSHPRATHQVFHNLTAGTDWGLLDSQTNGVWRLDDNLLAGLRKPYRGSLVPV